MSNNIDINFLLYALGNLGLKLENTNKTQILTGSLKEYIRYRLSSENTNSLPTPKICKNVVIKRWVKN